MEASIGKALREARLKKKLTVEDVARQTRIPLNRVIDLEKDEYAQFPSLAYARNFVLLYARFLGVDPAKYPLIDVGNPTVSSGYQYLQRGEPKLRLGPRLSERRPKGKKALWILLIFLAAVLTGIFVVVSIVEFMRLPGADQLVHRGENPEGTRGTPSPTPTATPEKEKAPGGEDAMSGIGVGNALPEASPEAIAPISTPTPEPTPSFTPEEAASVAPAEPIAPVNAGAEPPALGVQPGTEVPASTPSPTPEVPAASALVPTPTPATSPAEAPSENQPFEAATPSPTSTATPSATPTVTPSPTGLKEVRIRVTKRGRIRVVQDERNSRPIFDQAVSPGQNLVFRGKRFWVQASDPSGIKVTERPISNP